MPQKTAADSEQAHNSHRPAQHSPNEHNHADEITHSISTKPINVSRITGRGIGSSRIAMLQAAQQTYGNRAVQRMLHTTAPSEASAPTTIQREPIPGTFGGSNQSGNLAGPQSVAGNNPEAQSLYDQLIAQIKTVFQLKDRDSGANSEKSSEEMQKLQQLMQSYSMMMQMLSNISQSQHETSKNVVRNMR